MVSLIITDEWNEFHLPKGKILPICKVDCPHGQITVKALSSPWGAYVISGPKKGGLIREGGGLISSHIYLMKFTITFQTYYNTNN